MGIEQIVFYVFSGMLIASAAMVITVRNPVHAALFLVLCFVSSSALWLLLQAEFLAITLILVYVGAVMVLFLFVVMMLDINIAALRQGFARYLPIGGLVALLVIAVMTMVLGSDTFETGQAIASQAGDGSNTRQLGRVLYTVYVYPFEIASVILLVAIVAAIALTLRRRPDTKHQDVSEQVAVRRDERVSLVEMPAEKRR